MTIHRCDLCGKEVGAWFSITANIDAINQIMNVYDLLKYQGSYDICEECFKSWINQKIK